MLTLRRLGLIAVVLCAFALRAKTAGTFQVIDELQWMRRSEGFSQALLGLDPSAASVTSTDNPIGGDLKTMPGITTMWVGSAGKGLWTLANDVGIIHDDQSFTQSTTALRFAQTTMAAALSLLIGCVTWLTAKWAGWRAGLLVGVVLATEPFFVAHGAVLHTDEIQALLGTAGILALALALGLPKKLARREGLMALLAGSLLAGAALTKLSGLTLLPGAAALVAWAALRAHRRDAPEGATAVTRLKPVLQATALAVAGAIGTAAITYPALWASPSTEMGALRRARSIGYGPSKSFFMGDVISEGTPWFYLVALPFRMTPWLLVVVAVGVALALRSRSTRTQLAVLAIAAVPMAWTLSTIPKQFDRYGLTLVAFAAIAGSIGVSSIQLPTNRFRGLLASFAAIAIVASWAAAPWGLAWFNPLLGGGPGAQRNVPIEWQEGQSSASALMTEILGDQCNQVTYLGLNLLLLETDQCGTYAFGGEPSHLVVYVTEAQLMSDDELAARTAGRSLIGTLTIRGVDYATIWERDGWHTGDEGPAPEGTPTTD